ncbi:MAG: hypothetical protein KBC17_02120 [Candidatus Pacebacteria bacterium]|nr:hypothetical protein [Candidatus Paceibacterota bacterium]
MTTNENNLPETVAELTEEPGFSKMENLVIVTLAEQSGSALPENTTVSTTSAEQPLIDNGIEMSKLIRQAIVRKLDIESAGAHPLVNQGIQTAKAIVIDLFSKKTVAELSEEEIDPIPPEIEIIEEPPVIQEETPPLPEPETIPETPVQETIINETSETVTPPEETEIVAEVQDEQPEENPQIEVIDEVVEPPIITPVETTEDTVIPEPSIPQENTNEVIEEN